MPETIHARAVRFLRGLSGVHPTTEVRYAVGSDDQRSSAGADLRRDGSARTTPGSEGLEALYAANRRAAAQVYIESATRSGSPIPARIYAIAEVSPAPAPSTTAGSPRVVHR